MGIAVNALIATTAKQAAEAANFEVFKNAHPNFVGRPLLSVQWGGDPPDVLCLDAPGIRIGVELVQWVNGHQMAASKAQCCDSERVRTAASRHWNDFYLRENFAGSEECSHIPEGATRLHCAGCRQIS
jgi:hypothetical protein